jgi:hypothetical protein
MKGSSFEVVGDNLPIVTVNNSHFLQDLVRGRRPRKWLGFLVPVVDVVTDPLDQVGDRPEVAAADRLTRDDPEERLRKYRAACAP